MNNFSIKLKKKLLDLNLTQTELAKKIGVHKQVLANWLNGSRNPKRENIEKIAKALNVSTSFLSDDTPTIIPLNQETTIKLPILSTVMCGKPDYCELDEKIIDDFISVPKTIFPDSDFIVRCTGESMLPEIPPQAYCIIKKMDTPLNNKNMLVKTENGFTIKRVKIINGKIELHYLNPANKKIIPKELKIIGKVSGIFNKF